MLSVLSQSGRLSRRTWFGMISAGMAGYGAARLTAAETMARQEPTKVTPPTYLNAADFDLIGDGVTDDSGALQAAIDLAAAQRLTVVIPPGVYGVHRTILLRSGSDLSAYGATLITYIPELGDPGTSFPTIRISDVEDVSIRGLEIEGRKDVFAHSQWKHGFAINNAQRVRLFHCVANRCKGDGVILENKNIGDVCVDVEVEACIFGQNYRNGGTASGALRATFLDCVFWGTFGTKPMCGFDVEPDRPDVTCRDISFFRCDFSDNGLAGTDEGYGFNVSFQPDSTGPQSGVYLEDCVMARNGAAGVDLYRVPVDVELNNCQIADNAHDGIRIFADATNIAIRGGTVNANGHHGIHCAAVPDAPCQDIEINGTEITRNGWSSSSPSDGIHLNYDVRDVRILGGAISDSRGYGLFVAPTVTELEVSDTVFTDNRLGPSYPEMGLDQMDG